MKPAFQIETPRLLIREFTPDMAQAVHENSLDEDNRCFVPDEVWETVEEAAETVAFLITCYSSDDGPLVYPILTKDGGDNIGYVQLAPTDEGWEVGYHIAERFTGHGYATEAVQAFLPVIARQKGLDRILGICLLKNTASVKVMEKCGFTHVYTGPGHYQGETCNIVKNIWEP